ncbi:hypothetical protein OR1_03813 [Geobacter sp. OR-1]|uniref:hypothetical protein n=1 Tax=Geobacter sp. OR-1 TaxID=1266765 RepID=UPI00054409E3|nr:hypothetical protein [Geobacter sp. OR-1]GAM11497.1 hypothetical protein OR1_03813 [Geobacter sp. OR-1]
MNTRIWAVSIAIALAQPVLSLAAMYTIDNPADKISNPADKIFNPATQNNNPAINIYNPAGRMDNQNPLSPPTQPFPQPSTAETTTTAKPAGQICEPPQPKPKPTIPEKRYNFKTAKSYVTAAKKAFYLDKYIEFIAITEDALRRINDGTLKVSKKTKQKLNKFNEFGYRLLEKDEE